MREIVECDPYDLDWGARFTKDASFLIAGFFRPGVRGMSALSPSLSRQSPILRKTALFVRYACAALSRNRKLFFSVHGGKASG